jgi:hypothetical protein
MATFEFEKIDGLDDRAFVDVDGKYTIAIIRTDEGLIIDVWPEDWDAPIDTLGVCDADTVVDEDEA